MLADITWQGSPRKVMLWANRNGFWYVLDRTTGQFLSGKPFTKVNWMDGFDAKGRPNRVLNSTAEGTLIYPNNQGATNWYSPSFSPRTGLFYIPALDGHLLDVLQSGSRIQRGQPVRRTVSDDGIPGAENGSRRDQSAAARGWLRRHSGAGPEDR